MESTKSRVSKNWVWKPEAPEIDFASPENFIENLPPKIVVRRPRWVHWVPDTSTQLCVHMTLPTNDATGGPGGLSHKAPDVHSSAWGMIGPARPTKTSISFRSGPASRKLRNAFRPIKIVVLPIWSTVPKNHGTTMEQLWNNYGTTHGTTHGTTVAALRFGSRRDFQKRISIFFSFGTSPATSLFGKS